MTCYSLAATKDEAICIPLLNEEQRSYWTEAEEQELIKELADVIQEPTVTICNQNLLFDLWILFMEWGILPQGPIVDSMISFGIQNIGLQKGLGTIGASLTDVVYYKDDAKAWVENRLFEDWDNFQRYSARDSVTPLEACYGNSWHPGLLATQQEQGFQRTYDLTVRPFPVLLEMMTRGVAVDLEQLDIVAVAYQEHLKEKQVQLDEAVGKPLNPNSSKQCMEYFYTQLGITPYLNQKRKPTVDKKALMRLARRPESMAAAQLIIQIRAERKLSGTYFDLDLDHDNRLRSSWNPLGTAFGRLSSSSTIYGTGLNMQNLPPSFRSFLVAG
jgi:DNA polymerase I-like protein with 3'-5' exonuclease and polymerase domains